MNDDDRAWWPCLCGNRPWLHVEWCSCGAPRPRARPATQPADTPPGDEEPFKEILGR